jgi:hypothetical protein
MLSCTATHAMHAMHDMNIQHVAAAAQLPVARNAGHSGGVEE